MVVVTPCGRSTATWMVVVQSAYTRVRESFRRPAIRGTVRRMSWGLDFPLVELAQRLVSTRLRVERLRLAQRIQAVEAQAVAQGASPIPLKDLRAALNPLVPPAHDRVDRALVLPRKAEGYWRKRYLTPRTMPGSVF